MVKHSKLTSTEEKTIGKWSQHTPYFIFGGMIYSRKTVFVFGDVRQLTFFILKQLKTGHLSIFCLVDVNEI